MATYEELLSLVKQPKPSLIQNIGRTLQGIAARREGQQVAKQEEDTFTRDLLKSILLEQYKQKGKERIEALKQFSKTQQEAMKPPKQSDVSGSGQGWKKYANVDGQTVPIKPTFETSMKPPNLSQTDYEDLSATYSEPTLQVIKQVKSENDLQELLYDVVNNPQEFADAGVEVRDILKHFGLSDVGLKQEPVTPPPPPTIMDRIKGLF